jgi:hypothetical protein
VKAANRFRRQIAAFMAHDATNWTVVDVILPTREAAEATITKSKAKLEMRYEIGKQFGQALTPNLK